MSFKVYEEEQGITVCGSYNNTVARYILNGDSLQNIRNSEYNNLECIPFVGGVLKNPYSKYSRNYEVIEEVIDLYNSLEKGLPQKVPTFSFY
jgi:hypothetical protein